MKQAATITNQRDLAVAVGRSVSTVNTWLRRADWTFGRGPWSPGTVEDIRAWSQALNPSAADPEVSAARAELLTEQLALLNLTNAVAAGEYVDRATAERLVAAAVHAMKFRLLDMGASVAALAANATEADVRAELTRRITDAVKEYEAASAAIPQTATAEAEPVFLPQRLNPAAEGGRAEGKGTARPAGARPAGKGAGAKGRAGRVHRPADAGGAGRAARRAGEAGPAAGRKGRR